MNQLKRYIIVLHLKMMLLILQSVDGTWQKRGFTSYNGAVGAIYITTGRYCQGCVNIEKHKHNEHLYERLAKEYECIKNHEGSAPKWKLLVFNVYFLAQLKQT